MSWMRSLTFAAGPFRASRRLQGPPPSRGTAPPQSTVCSGRGISALPELVPNLPERVGGEPADMLGGHAVPLVDVLAVPAAGVLLDDTGRLAAVSPEGLVEPRPRRVVR